LNASSEFIFRESPDRLSDEASAVDAREFNEAFKYGQGVVGLRLFLGKLRFLIRDKEFWTRCKLVQDYTKRAITRSLQREVDGKGASKYNLVKELAAHSKNSDALSGHLLNVFIAGRDTPAVAMVNVLFCLARCPAAWAKIREEVAGLVPEDLSFEKLKSMRYLQHCINEGLRLYPALPTLVRVCLDETKIPYGGGPDGSQPICVVPGDTVTCNIYTLHRNPDVFGEDVESFRPERWKDIRPGWNYLPFSGGGRYCPAQQMSLFWVSHVIARMAMDIAEIVNKDPVEEYVENIQLTMESLNGVKVALVPA
jgi:cytochrome P450